MALPEVKPSYGTCCIPDMEGPMILPAPDPSSITCEGLCAMGCGTTALLPVIPGLTGSGAVSVVAGAWPFPRGAVENLPSSCALVVNPRHVWN